METIAIREARRLALTRSGLLKPEWTGMPTRATGRTLRARKAAHRVIRRFGYLQLDTVSVAGARSHAIVLLSRLKSFDPQLAEELLQPGEPLFEYWGHEASWIPMELYPLFEFRRGAYRCHPWWGDLISEHPQIVADLRRRITDEGPLRSLDMEGRGSPGWWNLKITKRVASALWSAGELAIRERRNFQRVYDLTERVIPAEWRQKEELSEPKALEQLLIRALKGHGWATTGTLAQTWRLKNQRDQILQALARLTEKGAIIPCTLIGNHGKKQGGWIRPDDFELAQRLKRVRPRRDQGVLLSPFDPLLWDRPRVKLLFDFDQVLEIFKPAHQRIHGYYCLPVLAGERLVARIDLKAERKSRRLYVLSLKYEDPQAAGRNSSIDRKAVYSALARYADALELKIVL
jgi:uncharacterized protein